MNIPLTKPYWGKEEERAAVQAIRQKSGSGDGPNTAKLTSMLQHITGAPFVLPVSSCTHGMELALTTMQLQSGDEVIVPSFTMSSTANAVLIAGGTPVFADIDPIFFNIDPEDVERKISDRTRGIVIVHYAGMACAMEKLQKIAKKHNLFIIEDSAHSIGAYYNDVMLGNWSDIGVYSFHGTKNISCGEGGAVMTRNKKFRDAMEVFRANGTNRKAFLEGTVDKYSWVGKGSSYFLSDILAAILVAQLAKIKSVSVRRMRIATSYLAALRPFEDMIASPKVPENCDPNWHIFAIRFRDPKHRSIFIEGMRAMGVEVSYHYIPLHSAPMGIRLSGGKPDSLPVTDMVSRSLVRLPIYPGLKADEIDYIIRHAVKLLKTIRMPLRSLPKIDV